MKTPLCVDLIKTFLNVSYLPISVVVASPFQDSSQATPYSLAPYSLAHATAVDFPASVAFTAAVRGSASSLDAQLRLVVSHIMLLAIL